MRLAILFSGQGQQTAEHLGFLREHVGKSSAAALKNALGMAWTERDPPINELSANVIAQPLIFGFEMLWWERLAPYLPTPICAAGYSLGEMAACSAAGLFSESAGIALCHERAKLMDANTSGDVTMLAVLGISEEKVAEVSSQFGLEMAIRNSPTHFVVTGTVAAINGAIDRFQAAGASKLTPVAVRTPSHTRFLSAASEAFAKTLEPYSQGNLMFPVISAVSGRMSYGGKDAAAALATQISSMLHWDNALETIVELRPDAVLEIGPGNSLSKMLGDYAPSIPVRSVCDFKSEQGVITWLGKFN